ncbi:RidA family protein [Microlunatus capsulatus]|uniref:Enamine deaminase RidA (YjgF/YER057c/UK114 family) n=1 Tax=Microlunatus capsulatus TaxID=99117 RepID=A0ABS4Z4Y0_9ACTN|nr:RidA family protein [Microlunatus capsulatus]MBP2416094.1 enamine deaminase RidA (YjgF/YER057c/UK114 family) [Microlunatus capsulatus]
MTAASTVRLLRSPALSVDLPYAHAATTDAPVRLVFTAGACPLDEEGRTVAVGDLLGQAERVLVNLRAALRAGGAELEDVLVITAYVASSSREDLAAVWQVVRRHFGAHDVPGTLLGVTVLGWPDQLVEVEAVAVARTGAPASDQRADQVDDDPGQRAHPERA